jgi:hypothetical protein
VEWSFEPKEVDDMKHAFFGRVLPAFTLAAVALASLPAAASPYTSLVVFGDSLSATATTLPWASSIPGRS